MDIINELIISSKLILALILGAIVGYERERDGKDAGLRTYASICVGACVFMLIASHLTEDKSAIARIMTGIVTGIGFIGAGIIFKDEENKPKGLTTASTIWCTASIGIAVGLNMFIIAIVATVLIFFLLALPHYKWYEKWKQSIKNKE
ncbi:hypothetical protein B0A58_14185 [Flavobacterium branchiophilum NBRC 15030 = ATCC 35035]|uniref:Putative Mg(2+) transporter, MgtC n=2 Tax=Flavobacterium branchiophilum TaxID=55197 RepID=G2Z6W7_FLABF|nr:MgtC/SapB family protein [Flavobacterium branchiophilum]OXA70735.1 hypothetical protein B0A58_14185 [Flavobacterium branchiophilum NBRC 15030 = ATCC 35035]TQM39738.1 putative Mg2+ transporter-C (MgtC) family protein [Flavobacterium branchiophilum]GEM55220.1 hypothetical protein FB1_14410 [Flavobacterium branchiophilum NBRC 15030 = ATCC 35035]CCB68963.1 Putative Mg(2+) transporter, MgtC [Flavobacterium branchiophilum FL-15]